MLGYVGMGSNLGDREGHLRRGIDGMAAGGLAIAGVSSLWETDPVDSPGAPLFLNAVAAVRTRIEPEEVLRLLLAVERREGRARAERNSPRTLDLDLLVLGERSMRTAALVLPHPRMWDRRFVLAPLAELAPDLVRPDTGRTVVEELADLPDRPGARCVGRLAMPERRPVYSRPRNAGEP